MFFSEHSVPIRTCADTLRFNIRDTAERILL